MVFYTLSFWRTSQNEQQFREPVSLCPGKKNHHKKVHSVRSVGQIAKEPVLTDIIRQPKQVRPFSHSLASHLTYTPLGAAEVQVQLLNR